VAVSDVSIVVRSGEIFSLIGPNGAGKTTVLNCISGVLSGTSGSVLFDGATVSGKRPHEIAAAGIARTFQSVRLFRPLSVAENVAAGCFSWQRSSIMACALRTRSAKLDDARAVSVARACIDFVGIQTLGGRRAAELSFADQRRAELARALAIKPKMLLLDEPAAGMNPTEKAALADLLLRTRDAGHTIMLIEHDMALVMKISDRVAVMDQGRLIALGPPQEVRRDPLVIDAYLGRDYGDSDEPST
jgi:ABC-type branched-subunit amino acid transport system ATPase component